MYIFIVGPARSGTTYMLNLVKEHPLVTHITGDMIGNPREDSLESGLFCVYPFKDALIKLHALGDGVFVEKTPDHSYHVGAILDHIKDCRIIYMVRDPVDVVKSCLGADFIKGDAKNRAGKYNLAAHMAIERAKDKRLLFIDYLELIHNSARTLRKVYAFCDLVWVDVKKTVDKHKDGKHVPKWFRLHTEATLSAEDKQLVVERCDKIYRVLRNFC